MLIPHTHRSFGARLAIVASIVAMAGFLMAPSSSSRLSPTGMCGSDGTVVIIDATRPSGVSFPEKIEVPPEAIEAVLRKGLV